MQAHERRFNVGFILLCQVVYTVSATVVIYICVCVCVCVCMYVCMCVCVCIYIYIYSVASSQGCGFPVVMYECELDCEESERQRIDASELWCWRRLLRVRWTARRSTQSILKETSPGCSLEGLMLKLKLQYFGHLMQRVDSLEKTLMLGGIGGRRRRGRQRMRWLDDITDSMDMSLSELR